MSNLFDYIGALYSDEKVKNFIEEYSLVKREGKVGEEMYLLTEDEKLSVLFENEELFVDDLYNKIQYEKDDFVVTALFLEDSNIEVFGFPLLKKDFFLKYGDPGSYNNVVENYRWFFNDKVLMANFDGDLTKKVQVQFKMNYA